jgi:NAD+-dependent protein deacetylase sirtuin 5
MSRALPSWPGLDVRTIPRRLIHERLISHPRNPWHKNTAFNRRAFRTQNIVEMKSDVEEFKKLLKGSNRVMALCGAGLSVASGLPTFRGDGGLWREFDPTTLATPDAFEDDPALVWLFYAWRRHMALKAKPNAGHYALAELAKKNENFLCLTQNVDGLSIRAGHPPSGIRMLHGNLLDVKCAEECGYVEKNVTRDPLCPALAAAAEDYAPGEVSPLLNPSIPTPEIKIEDLPHCPDCKRRGKDSLLRPAVVWFGEALPDGMLVEVDNWLYQGNVDIMLVIGTAATVYPAAGYTRKAQRRGAVVAVINPDRNARHGLGQNDFFFEGGADEFLPKLFEDVIGKLPDKEPETQPAA